MEAQRGNTHFVGEKGKKFADDEEERESGSEEGVFWSDGE